MSESEGFYTPWREIPRGLKNEPVLFGTNHRCRQRISFFRVPFQRLDRSLPFFLSPFSSLFSSLFFFSFGNKSFFFSGDQVDFEERLKRSYRTESNYFCSSLFKIDEREDLRKIIGFCTVRAFQSSQNHQIHN